MPRHAANVAIESFSGDVHSVGLVVKISGDALREVARKPLVRALLIDAMAANAGRLRLGLEPPLFNVVADRPLRTARLLRELSDGVEDHGFA